MEIKDIISKINKGNEEKKELFLALEISSETVKTAIWTVETGKTVMLKTGSIEEWEETDDKTLITAVDASLTKACEGIDEEPNKIIFGLPENWVEADNIAEDKKQILSNLSRKLELKPIGFVVTLEALTAFLKDTEGIPVNAIFVNLAQSQISVSLVQLGKISGSETVGRSEDLAADVREGLARFKQITDLPSRMILFNGLSDFEDAKQQLISYDWQEQLPFVHFPKVETLDMFTSVKAVAVAGGTEAAKSLGFVIPKEENHNEKEPAEIATGESFKTEITAADLGFVQNKDIQMIKIPKPKEKEEKPHLGKGTELPSSLIKSKPNFKVAGFVNKISDIIKSGKKLPGLFKFLSFKKGSWIILVSLLFIILFALAGFALYWYFPKAQIAIYLTPKTIEKELAITIDPKATQINFETTTIPGSFKEIESEGEQTVNTTGEKLVGDKAKGKIIIYNKSDLIKTFAAGTVLIGPNKLTFLLDSEVEVASKSANEEGEIYGKAESAVTAGSIGTDSNLANQSQLSFKDYPTAVYSAKTEGDLTGGTSRQVKAVDNKDLESLLASLTDELQTKTKESLKNQISANEAVLDKPASSEVMSKKFSAAASDEADTLKLDLKIKFAFLVYDQTSFNQFLIKKISDSIPPNFNLDSNSIQVDTNNMELINNKAQIKVVVKANLLPQLNLDNIKKDLVGKYPELAQEYFKNLPSFVKADISLYPQLPAKLNTLPRLIKNIQIDIKIEQ